MSRAILVTGATGKQGGAVIAALLAQKASFQMLALTRDSSSASARRLASQSPNITLIEGNLDDARSVFEKAKKSTSAPIWGVFSVQVRFPRPHTFMLLCDPSYSSAVAAHEQDRPDH